MLKNVIEKKDVDSSAIATVKYSYSMSVLTVTFNNGAAYDYYDVPSQVYSQVINSSSIGRSYVSLVKNNYESIKVSGVSNKPSDVKEKASETQTQTSAE